MYEAYSTYVDDKDFGDEIFFSPSRVLMQDYTGVPAIADLAAMRDRMAEKKKIQS